MKKHKKLSIDELKTFKGFENLTDEDAEKVISTLERLSALCYELFMKDPNQKNEQSNQSKHHETGQRPAA